MEFMKVVEIAQVQVLNSVLFVNNKLMKPAYNRVSPKPPPLVAS